jgi:23S rRNA (adenine2503-C2)-methyltransferase
MFWPLDPSLPGETTSWRERYEEVKQENRVRDIPAILCTGGPRYNLLTMNAAEFLPDVLAVLDERNEPPYRIRQIYRALTGSLVRDWKEATNLPKELQVALSEEAPAAALTLERISQASDGTRKYLFYTRDDHAIETVMIPEKARRTVCISTQVGCPMGCTFCATGLLGIKRNLKAREIAEQVFVCARDIAPERVTNVVVMGMGEPMLNYNATLGALRVLNDPNGFGLAARHIAVSTSGLVEKIRRFADEPEQFHLAISLHTPFDDERREIMPVAARHAIPELMDAARYFVTRTRRKLFFEYTLLAGVNDQPRHVEALSELLDHPLYHLNLLRFNWTDTGFSATSKAEAKRYLGYARELGLSATLRPSRGQDIDAACGQLAAKDLRGRPAVPMV